MDYDDSPKNVTFSQSDMNGTNACTNIIIHQDDVLECVEGFSVNIFSTSLPTQVMQSHSSVFITEDSKYNNISTVKFHIIVFVL